MKDVDLYDFKETLKEFQKNDFNFIDIREEKGVGLIEVGKTTKRLDKKLLMKGYKKGERLLVVIQ